MVEAIHGQESRAAARQKAEQVGGEVEEMKLAELERILREVREERELWERFPDGKSALMLAAARRRPVAGTKWVTRRYPDMNCLTEVSEAV